MKMMKAGIGSLVAIIAVMMGLFAAQTPAYAASTTRVITEEQINASYRVTNPARRGVSNLKVDLQPGKAVISGTWQPRKKDKTAVAFEASFTPSIENGRVVWTLVSVTSNGEPISSDLQAQLNNRISSSWARYAKAKGAKGKVTEVTISDSEITYTIER